MILFTTDGFFVSFSNIYDFLLWSPSPSVQNPKHGNWIHAAATTTMCPVPSSTRVRSSSCPTLRTRASGCGICPKGLECRPSAVTTIGSGCLGLTQTSTCLPLVGGECCLCLYEFNKVKGSQRSCFEHVVKYQSDNISVKISDFLLVKIAPPPAAEELLHINLHCNNEYVTIALKLCLCLF